MSLQKVFYVYGVVYKYTRDIYMGCEMYLLPVVCMEGEHRDASVLLHMLVPYPRLFLLLPVSFFFPVEDQTPCLREGSLMTRIQSPE